VSRPYGKNQTLPQIISVVVKAHIFSRKRNLYVHLWSMDELGTQQQSSTRICFICFVYLDLRFITFFLAPLAWVLMRLLQFATGTPYVVALPGLLARKAQKAVEEA